MKRIHQDIRREVQGLKPLYLGDYFRLVEILSQNERRVEVRIDDELLLEAPTEISDIKRDGAKEIRICSWQHSRLETVTVGIRKAEATIHFNERPDDGDPGIALQALDFLNSRRSPIKAALAKFPLVSLLFTATFGLIAVFDRHIPKWLFWWINPPLWILYVFAMWRWAFPGKNVVLILKHREDAPSFFARNKEQMKLGAFFAILGAFLTLVGQAIIRTVFPGK